MGTDEPTASAAEPAQNRSRLAGRYELETVLGHGGMAVVWLGTDLRLGRTVAVKMLRGELAEAPAFQARFRREARAAAALDHPAIVSVYDAGEETVDGAVALYIVMEYVDGQTLRDLVRTGPQAPRRALELTAAILDALENSHRCGIVHRDVKPANVMVTTAGAVKVMDFGVARAVADMSASLTQTSTVIGTAHYLSPEQARGESVDARSDVYSTGCLLYELLTGRPPFQGDSAIAVAFQHVREPPQPPSTFEPSVPPEIDSIVMAALAKRPDERYQSAAQMRSDILGVLAGERAAVPMASVVTTAEFQPVTDAAAPIVPVPGSATVDSASADDGAGGRHHRRNAGLMIAAVLLAVALAGFALSGLSGDRGSGQDAQQRPVPGGGPGQPPPTQGPADSLEPAGSSHSGSSVLGEDEQPRRAGDAGAKPDRNDTDKGDRAAVDQDPRRQQPEPAQRSAPPSTPTSPSTPVETTPAESQPAESPEPQPSQAEETPAPTPTPTPTTPPPAEEQANP